MADTNDTPNVVSAVPTQSGVPLQPVQTGYVPEDTEYAHLNQPDTLDVAGATWRSTTLVGQLYNNMRDGEVNAAPDPSFNPYSYVEQNKKQYEDLLPLITQGSANFDGIDSQAGFDHWAAAQRRNLADRQTLAEGNTWQTLATMPMSMLDATLLLGPVGEAAGAASAAKLGSGILARAAGGAVTGGLEIGAQQAGVSALNDTTTPEEAFMNIGVGLTLGAGLGAVFRGAKPETVKAISDGLHPDNLDRAIPINEHQVGQLPSEGAIFGADSIGAARATADEDSLIATSPNPIAKAVDWLTTLGKYTPLQRLGSYSNALTRDSMLRLMDTGGLMTRAMVEGKSTGLEAETLKTIYEQRMASTRGQVDSIYRDANAALGQSSTRTTGGNLVNTITQGAKDINIVPQQAFNTAVSMIQRGSNAQATNEEISRAVTKALTDAGLSRDQAALVHPHVYKAEKAYHDAYDGMWTEAVRQGLADPEKATVGRYGMPQRWLQQGADSNSEGLKAFFMEHLQDKPTDDWLRENGFISDPNKPTQGTGEPDDSLDTLGASWDDLKKNTDPTTLNSILRQWAGEQNQFQNDYLASRLAEYQQRQLKAQEHAVDMLGTLKMADKDWSKSKLREMHLAARDVERRAVLRKVASAQLKAQRAQERMQAALDRLGGDEGTLADVQNQMVQSGMELDEAGAAIQRARERHAAAQAPFKPNAEGTSLVDALRGRVSEIQESKPPRTKAGRPARQEIADLRQQVRDAQAERKAAQAELDEANRGFDQLAKQQANSRRWHDAAVKEVNTIIKNEDEALLEPGLRKEMDDHIATARDLHDTLETAREARRQAFDVMKQSGMDARAAAKAADRASSQLRRVAFQARRGTSETSPLTQYVDGLVNDLRGSDRAPRGVLLDKSPTSGRLKERQFQFSFDEYNHLVDSGYLAGNADDAFQGYMRDLGGQLAAHRALEGRDIGDILTEVQGDYDRAIGSETDPKKKAALQAEMKSALDDVKTAHDRILGKYDIKDHNGLVWTADRLKQMGIVRYMGGFVFASIGDLATAAFSAPGSAMKALLLRGSRDFKYILEKAKAGDPDGEELAMILGSLETGAHLNSSDRALGRGEAADMLGFGTGRTRAVTRGIEQAMNTMSDLGNKMSFMKGWSDNIRRTAGLVQLGNVRKWVAKYDTLDKGKVAQLGALGIGEAEAKRLNALFDKYGTDQRQGLFSPGISKWLSEKDGEHMKYVLESALIKAQKRASYTSGYGNQPLLMDKWYGKLFLQFQSMAMQFSNNFIRAGSQYGFVTGDHMRFAGALGIALAAGLASHVIAAARKGAEVNPANEEPQQLIYDVIQRSGLLGASGSYVDAVNKLTDPALQSNFGFTLGGQASKFSQNSWLGNLMGPWLNNVESLEGIGVNAVNGQFDKVGQKALQLAPLNQQFQIIQRLVSANQ